MNKKGITRRDFLKSAAATVGAVTIGFSGITANAFAEGETGEQKEETPAYEIIDCGDLIILGAGNAAVGMARAAIKAGKHVTIIDKGPFGFSGASGFNWDVYTSVTEVGEHREYLCSDGSSQLINADLTNASVFADPVGDLQGLEMLQRGQVLPDRNPDGTNHWYYEMDVYGIMNLKGIEGVMMRPETDQLKGSPMIKIYDRTMATDYLINDGRCVGVTAVYLPTGDYRVFRAKAVIDSTGGSCWFYGWTGASAFTNNSADNTGDMDIAALRHGAAIAHGEFPGFDFVSIEPIGMSYGWGVCVDADGNEPWLFCDKDGNQLWPNAELTLATMDRAAFNQSIATQMVNNNIADEDGCIRIVTKNQEIRDCTRTNITALNKFDVHPEENPIKAHNESYEHLCSPIVDATAMTEISGVFKMRGAGSVDPVSSQVGSGSNYMRAAYAAQCVCAYIDALEELETIDFTPAAEEFARLDEIRMRQNADSIRPYVVRQEIQNLCGKVWGLIRTEADQAAAVEELERIRKEDMPRMCISSSSKTYNTEWKEAIENYNLLYVAECSVKASLERKETRGQYLYVDYPEKDDENFNCTLACRLADDGSIDISKYYFNAQA